jgi:hypothetical protein
MAFDPLSDPNKKASEIDALIKKDAEEKARKDAEGETLDKLLSMLTTINDRMDSMEANDKARADAEAAAKESSDPEPVAADSNEEEKMEPKMDSTGVFRDTFGDAVYRADSHKSREQWQNDASLAQSTADRIYRVGGSAAPQICEGESLRAYRIRLLTPMQHTSAAYAKIDSAEFKKLPAAMFAIAERQVYCDADKSARNPNRWRTGRNVTRIFSSGRGWQAHSVFCWNAFVHSRFCWRPIVCHRHQRRGQTQSEHLRQKFPERSMFCENPGEFSFRAGAHISMWSRNFASAASAVCFRP